MSLTRVYYHPDVLDHDAGPCHPERPDRVSRAWRHLQTTGLTDRICQMESLPAPQEAIETSHTVRLIDDVRRVAEGEAQAMVDPDTVITPATWRAALLGSGGAIQACDAVLDEGGNAFCLHRPPGHHAERDRAMGFCFFNHIAVAARHLVKTRGLERVAIVDWDVHHGNGTQHTFDESPNVFFCSIHQSPHYPGTGAAIERGTGAGEGTTLNVPVMAGQTDDDYLRIMQQSVGPALETFEPQFILVSAGFDAHAADPLGDMRISTAGFRQLTDLICEWAHQWCDGRCVSLLEGGYDLEATSASIGAHLEGLLAAPSG